MIAGIISNIKKHPFVWTIIFLTFLFYTIQNIKERFWMNDLVVAYTAAQQLLSGQQIYGKAFGLDSGFYKYSPFTLFLFAPFALLPFFIYKTICFFTIAGLIIYTTLFLERFLTEHFFSEKQQIECQKVLFLSTLVVVVHYERELHMGNYNVLILAILLVSLNFILHDNEYIAGILLGLIMLMKPHFLVLFPLFLLRKKVKTWTSLTACILCGLLFPGIFLGWQKNVELHSAWMNTILTHNTDLTASPNTLQAWLYKTGIRFLYPEVGSLYAFGVIVFVALLLFVFLMHNYSRERTGKTEQFKEKLAARGFIFEYLLIIALIPNIVATDTEHFLWSLPIIMFIITYLLYDHKKRTLFLAFSIPGFSLYGGNWHDAWGSTVSVWIHNTGLLGLGNILILLNAVYIFQLVRKK